MSQSFLPPHLLAPGSLTASIDEAGNPLVKQSIAYWRSLKGERRFPARDTLSLRGMAAFLRYTIIVHVLDRAADYEFTYVGDAQREAFKSYFKGLRVSQLQATAPEFGNVLRGVYDIMRANGVPFIVRGRTGTEPVDSKSAYFESAFLPLGASDAAVDHILVVGVRIPEPFWDLSEKDRNVLASQSEARRSASRK
ncbi:MAG: hypothetical protein ACTHPD_15355 [Rhizomicrobium sp.]